MRHQHSRVIYGTAAKTTYRTSVHDAPPASITVGGAAATFTSAIDPAEGVRTVTITAPPITQGVEIRLNYDGLTGATDYAATLVEMPECIESGQVTSAVIGTQTLWGPIAIGNYNLLTLSLSAIQTSGSITVEVTNDPTAAAGWTAVRGLLASTGAALSAASTAAGHAFYVAGFKFARVRAASGTAGTYNGWFVLSRGTAVK